MKFFQSRLILVVVIFIMALLLRGSYLYLSEKNNLFPDLYLDSKYYQKIAVQISQGFGAGDHPYLLSPLYPYLLAPFIDENNQLDTFPVKVIQSVLGSITCVLLVLIALSIWSYSAAWLAGLIAALYGPLIHYDQLILVASIQTFTITLAVWLLVSLQQKPFSVLLAVTAGIVLGFSSALRPTGILLVMMVSACFVLLALIEKNPQWIKKCCLPFLLGVAVIVSPFTLRNHQVSGEWILLSANGGMNFWVGNHKDSRGVFNLPPDYDLVHDPLGVDIARKQSGKELGYTESSSWWREKAVNDIVEEPLRWVGLIGAKLLLFAHNHEIPQLGLNFHWYQKKAWPLQVSPLNGLMILVLALLAPLMVMASGDRKRLMGLAWPLLFLVVYWAGVSLFFITGRYRAPVTPVAIVLAAIFVVIFIQGLFKKDQNLFALFAPLVMAIALVAGGSKLFASGVLLPPANLYSGAEERQRGMAFYKSGKFREAEKAYRQSLAIRENYITRGNLANALKAQGRIDEAEQEYLKVLEAKPNDAVVLYNVGNLYRDYKNDLVQAIGYYQKSVSIQPRFAEAHLNLGILLARVGKFDLAQQALQNYLQHAPVNVDNRQAVEQMVTELEVRKKINFPGAAPAP